MTDKLRQWVHETMQANKEKIEPVASGQHAEEVEFWLRKFCEEIETRAGMTTTQDWVSDVEAGFYLRQLKLDFGL